MNSEYYQPSLFPELTDQDQKNKCYLRYQIKRIDDPLFGISLHVEGEEDPETVALEQLGYFVVPELNVV